MQSVGVTGPCSNSRGVIIYGRGSVKPRENRPLKLTKVQETFVSFIKKVQGAANLRIDIDCDVELNIGSLHVYDNNGHALFTEQETIKIASMVLKSLGTQEKLKELDEGELLRAFIFYGFGNIVNKDIITRLKEFVNRHIGPNALLELAKIAIAGTRYEPEQGGYIDGNEAITLIFKLTKIVENINVGIWRRSNGGC